MLPGIALDLTTGNLSDTDGVFGGSWLAPPDRFGPLDGGEMVQPSPKKVSPRPPPPPAANLLDRPVDACRKAPLLSPAAGRVAPKAHRPAPQLQANPADRKRFLRTMSVSAFDASALPPIKK